MNIFPTPNQHHRETQRRKFYKYSMKSIRTRHNHPQAAIAIAGDEGSTRWDGAGVISPSPELLFSLGTALLPLAVSVPGALSRGFRSLSPLSSAATLASTELFDFDRLGVRHEGSCHMIPVKLRSCRGLRSHLRHALPERSNARKPALMAPVLAFGPRRCAAGSFVASPSSLKRQNTLVRGSLYCGTALER